MFVIDETERARLADAEAVHTALCVIRDAVPRGAPTIEDALALVFAAVCVAVQERPTLTCTICGAVHAGQYSRDFPGHWGSRGK